MITIQYWPILARSSGLFRMCAEAGIPVTHLTSKDDMNAALFGVAESSNLVPPIIKDGDVILSQAVPCHQYIGSKCGLDKGIPVPEVALQYMLDLNDLHAEMKEAAVQCKDNVEPLQKYLTGDRYKYHLGAINRSIKGPFYFGDTPTYVDFAVCSYLDMCEGKWLNPLELKTGDTIAKYSPKLRSIATYIRDLPSAKQSELITNLPQVPAGFVLKPEIVASWK